MRARVGNPPMGYQHFDDLQALVEATAVTPGALAFWSARPMASPNRSGVEVLLTRSGQKWRVTVTYVDHPLDDPTAGWASPAEQRAWAAAVAAALQAATGLWVAVGDAAGRPGEGWLDGP